MLRIAFRNSKMVLRFENKTFIQTDPLAHELYEFTEKIRDLSKNQMPGIYIAAVDVLSTIDNSSMIMPSENPNNNFHGISIFSPPFRIIYRFTKRMYKSTAFAKDTNWDELLNLYNFRRL